MRFINSWGESLALLRPASFRLLVLASVRTAGQVYQTLLFRFWPIVLVALVFHVGCYYPECLLIGPAWYAVEALLFLVLAFLLLFLVRPSVWPKGYHLPRLGHFLGFCVYYPLSDAIRFLCGMALFCNISGDSALSALFKEFVQYAYISMPIIIAPLFVCWSLFFLDARPGCMFLWRGFKMVVYNFPLFFILLWISFFLYKVLLWVNPQYGVLLFYLFVPFVLALYKTVYVKRLYDQFSLYYPNE